MVIIKSRLQSRQEQKKRTIEWGGYEGAEAIKKWRERAEGLVIELLDRQVGRPDPYMSTAELILFIMQENTGSYEIGYPSSFSKGQAARGFRAILDGLSTRGKIKKEDDNSPKIWVSSLAWR
jgi:hypothetical protein